MAIPTLREGQAELPTEHPTQAFWHTEPNPILLGRKSELPATADVVIVGSGITGAFAAWHLKQHKEYSNKSVIMLEAREACWGATGRNGGHCQPNVYNPPSHIAKFELATFKFLHDAVSCFGIDCDWVTTEGVHSLMTDDLVDNAKAKMEKLKDHPELSSLARLVLSSEELEELGVPSAKAAIVQKNAAALWPYKLVAFFLEKLVEGHAEGSFSLQTNTPVLAIQRINGSASEDSWVLHTPRGQVATSKALLCCNGYISHILPEFTGLVVPVRGQMAGLTPPATLEKQIGHSYVFMGHGNTDIFRDDYLIQRGENSGPPRGMFLLGGGRGHDAEKGLGVSDDGVIDNGVAKYLRTELGRELDIGSKDELGAQYQWTGIMGYSRDGNPWVGPVPETLGGGPGLWVSGGYTGHGMPVGARCAQGAVDMMVGVEEGKARVEIPAEFLITEERLKAIARMDTVHEADKKGFFM
ncbi:uncharacterized protein MKZ38_001514 [Zalerion maritima]|uniref:FAD dependent oxidoreductase domain-containing protein n=1 Tax=Zalerion maritima TaxID=339359 RepID=A0AAD5RQT7_9PEZI|nr:uncharacterized protein MKZ38_001514 [Zalerion maritima]